MATHLTNKQMFLKTIVPVTLALIIPIIYYKRHTIIKPRINDIRLLTCGLLIITNIIVYFLEKQINYYILHSIHHLICFSVPGLLIEYKNNNKNLLNENKIFVENIIKKIPSLTDISIEKNKTITQSTQDFSSYTNLEDIV